MANTYEKLILALFSYEELYNTRSLTPTDTHPNAEPPLFTDCVLLLVQKQSNEKSLTFAWIYFFLLFFQMNFWGILGPAALGAMNLSVISPSQCDTRWIVKMYSITECQTEGKLKLTRFDSIKRCWSILIDLHCNHWHYMCLNIVKYSRIQRLTSVISASGDFFVSSLIFSPYFSYILECLPTLQVWHCRNKHNILSFWSVYFCKTFANFLNV